MSSRHRGVLACWLPACSWLFAARSPGVLRCWYADKDHQDHKQLHWSHWRWFWSSMWCLSNVVCGHRKTPETCLWDIVIKTRHLGTLTTACCKPQNIRLLPADQLWRKLLGVAGIYFVMYFKGLLWPDRQAGCSWSPPSPSWCTAEVGGLSTSNLPGRLTALPHTWHAEGQAPTHRHPSQPVRELMGGWHPQPSMPPDSSHLKQLFSPPLKCVSWVLSCMSLKLGLASQGGWTLTKSF